MADMLKHLKEMNMAATINPIDPYYDKQSSKTLCEIIVSQIYLNNWEIMSLMQRYIPLNNVPLNFIRIVIKFKNILLLFRFLILIDLDSYIIRLV